MLQIQLKRAKDKGEVILKGSAGANEVSVYCWDYLKSLLRLIAYINIEFPSFFARSHQSMSGYQFEIEVKQRRHHSIEEVRN